MKRILTMALITLAGLAVLSNVAFSNNHSGKHQVAFHLSSDDPATVNLVFNNATNVSKHYGKDKVDIQIVAYGPGLKNFLTDSKFLARIRNTHDLGNVNYALCNNTLKKMKKTKKDLLSDEFVQDAIVPAGVVHLSELQEQGWSYIRP